MEKILRRWQAKLFGFNDAAVFGARRLGCGRRSGRLTASARETDERRAEAKNMTITNHKLSADEICAGQTMEKHAKGVAQSNGKTINRSGAAIIYKIRMLSRELSGSVVAAIDDENGKQANREP